MIKLMGCGCNELIKSTRETIFGNTSNAALRLTQDEAESWMTFVEFTVSFHLCCENLRVSEEQQKLGVDKANVSVRIVIVALFIGQSRSLAAPLCLCALPCANCDSLGCI